MPLAPYTTFGVGGPARYLARCATASALAELAQAAAAHGMPTFVLGGGSNLLVSDQGFAGLVLQLAGETLEMEETAEGVALRVGAGVVWDDLVARTVAAGLGGLECLSGIPGWVGAAPMQNIGAYGQEVAEALTAVEVVEMRSGLASTIPAARCGFGYRSSHFKGRWRGRYLVTHVRFQLPRQRLGTVRYGDLEQRFAASGQEPTLAAVRQAVLAVRRAKAMVLDPEDADCRSAGSFFVNPVLPAAEADEVVRRAAVAGIEAPLPRYPAADGQIKLPAAWLIEQAGFRRGFRQGRAGLSTRHSLALTNRGGATAAEIVALAARIRGTVRERFGVTLQPEPVFLGFEAEADDQIAELTRRPVS